MASGALSAVSLVTILVLTLSAPAFAGELRLTFQNGKVTLVARGVTLGEIFAEWERVGGTRIVNKDAAPATPVTLDLADVPEARALAILLRQTAGYFGQERGGRADTASRFARIVILHGAERLAAGPPESPSGRPFTAFGASEPTQPLFQQLVMPDGRVLDVMEHDGRPPAKLEAPVGERYEGENTQPPPVGAPATTAASFYPGSAPSDAGAAPSAGSPVVFQGTMTSGEVPTRATASVPAAATKPGTYVPGPIKPPGI